MTSLEWWTGRPEGFEATLPGFPTLDEAWLWYLAGRAKRGEPLHSSLEAMCHYAEDVRQGRWPDTVDTEVAVQSVYLALAQQTLAGGDRGAFEREAKVFFDAVAAHLESGHSLVEHSFLNAVPALQKHVAALRADHRLFGEDLARARKLKVTLPEQATRTGQARQVSLLVLDRPAATQFKLWARRDLDAALLLVRTPDGSVVLSADPAKKLSLSWLAAPLSEAEGKAWYDGARHAGTLVASPKEGTRLSLDDVVSVLSKHAKVSRRRPALVLGALATVVVAIVAGLALRPSEPQGGLEPSPPPLLPLPPAPTGAKGDPIPAPKVIDLLASAEGPKSFQGYALVAGVCGYQGERALEAPCGDARAVRDLLVSRLGYAKERVLFFVDQPEPGEVVDGTPTARDLKLALEKFRERFPGADDSSNFLFYYSGHGGYEKGARQDFGVLQPSGYFDDESRPISERGWDMQELLGDIRKGVPSKHVMLVIDACYAGWAVGAKGDEQLRPEVRTLWSERAEVILTAGTKGQRAWEDESEPRARQWGGHSALTAFVLEGLGASGTPQADANGDTLVTDEELAGFVRTRVPAAVRELKRAEQTPQFFRFDEHLPKSGQFLFLPESP